jgi:hypothetical protein
MKHKQGHSLVSFLLYVLLSSLIVCLMFHSISYFIVPSLRSIQLYKEQISLHMALDLFVKEIRVSAVTQWQEIAADSIIWSEQEKSIGWRCINNRLERIQGIYKSGDWKKRRSSVVATHIHSLLFRYDIIAEKLVGIEIVLTGSHCLQKPVRGYVGIRG